MQYVSVDNEDFESIPWQRWTKEQWQQWTEDGLRWPMQSDSTVPPAEMLVEWAEEHGGDERSLRSLLSRSDSDLSVLLDDPPAALTAEHAEQLEDLTAIPARIWRRFEAHYRGGMARLALLEEMRAALGPSVSPGEMLKQWADEHDPDHAQLKEMLWTDGEIFDLLTNRHELTPENALLLAALTKIPIMLWTEQDAAWRTWMSEQKEKR